MTDGPEPTIGRTENDELPGYDDHTGVDSPRSDGGILVPEVTAEERKAAEPDPSEFAEPKKSVGLFQIISSLFGKNPMANQKILDAVAAFRAKANNPAVFTPDEIELANDLCDVAEIGASSNSVMGVVLSGGKIIGKVLEIVTDVKQLANDFTTPPTPAS